MIKVARTERGLSQSNLAQRLNISRYSIMALEKGSPTVAVGIVFEAAVIVGIPLFAEDTRTVQQLKQSMTHFNALLPQRVRHKNEPIDDNF
jgi:DNA-binding XRE family transcriptional regulator